MSGQTSRSRAYHSGAAKNADHFIYRIYDADHVLLYIGCTVNVKKRIGQHRAGSSTAKASRWLAATMCDVDVTGPYGSRDAARDAEADAIQTEQPVFNYQRRAGIGLAAWMTRSGVGRYLLEHGHRELAEETACTCWGMYRDVGEFDPLCVPHEHLALPKDESHAFDEPDGEAVA